MVKEDGTNLPYTEKLNEKVGWEASGQHLGDDEHIRSKS
jgi:hypothetical protein